MFLKRLTLRGFKSFADRTELDFEPGITVIVGPNGSGKSNVADALTWVLGSHSAKSLRGGSMADVIFAGAPGRPGLGRASVEITIDNSDGALPIEFREVTISRAMFASGENDYAINGTACRLMDVQELLSDTGLGRENHTIVGQGQLDAVLNARPEERRAFIEEAAGIGKHRRRKERALRKLAQTDAHVERLVDVVRELRRNLRPLQRQAEAAGRHAELAGQLREVRVTRAVRRLDELTVRHDELRDSARLADERHVALEAELAAARRDEQEADAAVGELTPAARAAAETHFALANLVERYRGLAERIAERRAGLAEAVDEPVAGPDPARLRSEAAVEQAAAAAAAARVESGRAALAAAEAARSDAELARRAHEQAAAAEARRRAAARERRLRWEGEVAALRSGLAQAAGEEGRLAGQLSSVRGRRDALEADRASVRADIQRLDTGASALASQLATAETRLHRRQEAADAAAHAERELERRRASLEARAEALRAASREPSQAVSAALAAARDGRLDGVLGPLGEHVAARDGLAPAVAAALGPLGEALVVSSPAAAVEVLTYVREAGAGRVVLLPGAGALDGVRTEPDLSDVGARPLAAAITAEPPVAAALAQALAGAYVVGSVAVAADLAQRFPGLVFVTVAGEVAGPKGLVDGRGRCPSPLLTRAAADRAEVELAAVVDELHRAHRRVADTGGELVAARDALDAATAAMQESDSLVTAAAERLSRLDAEHRTCERELDLLQGQVADLEREVAERRDRLDALERRGADAPEADDTDGPDLEAERLDDVLADAREAEVQARLAAGAAEQATAELLRRVAGLQRQADDVERQLAERELRRRRRSAALARCGQLAEVAAAALDRAEESLRLASIERDRFEEARAERQRRLGALHAILRDSQAAAAAVREARHRKELAAAEVRHDLDAVRGQLREEFALDPDAALAGARAHHGDALAGGPERDAELAESEERLAAKVALLGAVNPLAQQQLSELAARETFLTDQLEDLRACKADLLRVVAAVDDRIREIFASAFTDVADAFADIFPRLFPGGEGRLVLTDPDDLLASGVDVEARPPGKRVKRLSLLSGGERSLTALAVLFAIFTARPSPFYVLDEVEAALDDVNLQRLLAVLDDFRACSQLLVVSHQKRTMEAADTLYGVTMRADGVSKVVSQRLSGAPGGAAQPVAAVAG